MKYENFLKEITAMTTDELISHKKKLGILRDDVCDKWSAIYNLIEHREKDSNIT
ncbi:hypothetical protein RLOatenuis_6930 [Rickettsiales bacterium]|nr:hypothetical protein RLOatenuis_6930 [Rickettsiales bacterium]